MRKTRTLGVMGRRLRFSYFYSIENLFEKEGTREGLQRWFSSKSARSSCRGPAFSSQHPHWVAHSQLCSRDSSILFCNFYHLYSSAHACQYSTHFLPSDTVLGSAHGMVPTTFREGGFLNPVNPIPFTDISRAPLP